MPISIHRGSTTDWDKLKQEIISEAPNLGIDSIGFTTADPFNELKELLIDRRDKGYLSGFEEPDIDKRINPGLLFEGPRSIISIAVAYPTKLVNPPRSEPGAYRGMLSRTAWGLDYHQVLRERLTRLEAFIKERVEGARVESMVDTGALVDRSVAERAGVGFIGKNCSVITPEWGSWVFLGEMITNIPFPPDTPALNQCGECTKCLDACPTGAFVGPGELNASRCIAFLTQTKGVIEDELMKKIGNRLYGCDTCQSVCPLNKGKHWTHQADMQPDPELVKPLLAPLLSMSNREYKQVYGNNASSWRGKKPIQRNAIIGIGNFKDRSSVPLLNKLLRDDDRPEIRATAAWALGKIGDSDAEIAIEVALLREKEKVVLDALERAQAEIKNTCKANEQKEGVPE
ncbi:tRNA epoxyqueuosine(34) reductase QueG [Paenibacillus albiflavus]|uniref:tRNA epoxyqueuosine(34) reductase QueG n=1 Tax=Paenibacillus albiflavus TaxID=2545760 RepID=A0A4R4EHE1_9BACL|nr:tRNA epoxyqueuosine(34) reductase QueG [Paenibacillus albiflavus]TCZ77701.1 tRNA epoxyqueuosine(34) reductase QueG [Paenibacillus albiflavus]